MLTVLTLAAVCSASPVAERYTQATRALEETRRRLARGPRATAHAAAREAVLAALDEELFPAWAGTPWAFHGTTETPREGAIACGYYVTTLLRDAGFRIERAHLARQASEWIVKTLAAERDIQRFRGTEPGELVRAVRSRHGTGLFVVGMDLHVGLLRLTETEALLCHAAVLAPQHAVCEDAVTSAGMVSRYHVVGPVLTPERLEDWLRGRPVPSAR